MTNFDPLIDAIKQQMQPVQRAQHLTEMLQQLFVLTPDDVTLADLAAGWQVLSRPQSSDENGALAHRREVCARLFEMTAPLTNESGHLAMAVKTWQAWHDAFQRSADPRQAAMTKTLVRELAELQSAR